MANGLIDGMGTGAVEWAEPLYRWIDESGNVVASIDKSGNMTVTGVLAYGSTANLSGALDLANDFAINTNKFTVAAASGNTTVAGTLAVTGVTTLSDDLVGGASTDIAINTDKFTVAASSGNTVVAGTLAVTGATAQTGNLTLTNDLIGGSSTDIAINTNKFTVAGSTGNTVVGGTLTVDGAQTLTGNTTASGTLAVTGATTLSSTLAVTGASTLTGNVSLGGTLGVTGTATHSGASVFTGATTQTGVLTLADDLIGGASSDIAINTNKFTVAASSGNTAIAGTLAVTGASTLTGATTQTGVLTLADDLIGGASTDIAINTNKFTVAASSGNTAIGGTLAVTGASTLTGNVTASGTLAVTGASTLTGAITASNALTVAGTTTLNGTLALGTQAVTRTALKHLHQVGAKVGATAGWAVNAADNLNSLARLPASQTGSTLVIPISGLKVGDTLTGVHLVGQIESAGGICTLDASLRKQTAAAAGLTDAELTSGAMTQISVTADTIISSTNSTITPTADVVGADETFYVLLTGTTAAATDIDLQAVASIVTGS